MSLHSRTDCNIVNNGQLQPGTHIQKLTPSLLTCSNFTHGDLEDAAQCSQQTDRRKKEGKQCTLPVGYIPLLEQLPEHIDDELCIAHTLLSVTFHVFGALFCTM